MESKHFLSTSCDRYHKLADKECAKPALRASTRHVLQWDGHGKRAVNYCFCDIVNVIAADGNRCSMTIFTSVVAVIVLAGKIVTRLVSTFSRLLIRDKPRLKNVV